MHEPHIDEKKATCKRCGAEYTNPIPEVTRPDGNREIACKDWCAECNAYVMSVIHRWSTAYVVPPDQMHDPLKGGKRCP